MTVDTRRIDRLYRNAAAITFNTALLFVGLNLVLWGVFWITDRVRSAQRATDSRLSGYRERFADLDAYGKISRADASRMLDEQDAKGSLGLQFHPWNQFREPTFQGRFLNVDEHGVRRTRAPSPRPGPEVDVFVFGGSTTFGYGVPDDHTIPSYLQVALERKYGETAFRVRNLGQGYYYSSQELIALIEHIKRGDTPDIAVFIDGANDLSQLSQMRDQPAFTPTLKRMWDARNQPMTADRNDYSWIPVVRAVRSLMSRVGFSPSGSAITGAADKSPFPDQDSTPELTARRAEYVLARYLANVRIRRAICREHGIRCTFVWQPHVAYKYDRTLHKTFPWEGAIPRVYGAVFARMENFQSSDYLYLGDLFDGVHEKIYVDDVHYNETWNERIADRIAEVVRVQ